MRTSGIRLLVCTVLALAFWGTAACAANVAVAFYEGDRLYFVERSVTGPDLSIAALQSMLNGPTASEAGIGITSAIPSGTALSGIDFSNGRVIVDLSSQALANGTGEWEIERIYKQVSGTLRQFFPDLSVSVLVGGNALYMYAPPTPKVEPRPKPLESNFGAMSGSLLGKSVALSPGHGYYWLSTYYTTQRGSSCGYDPEDFHNVLIARYLKIFLENDGAVVKSCRDMDMGAGNGPNSQPWWKQGSYIWLWHMGYPASIFAASTGDNPPGSAPVNESSDDIRARPLMSDYENTDIYLSIHTNALTGYCGGGSCPTGSETYYDASSEHAEWATVSQNLANNVNGQLMAAIQSNVNNIPYGAWTCHGTCVKNSDGAYGEIRIPDRAATLTELAFHDSCDRDALLIEDPFFQSVAMWGMYKGVCDYFGVVPSNGIYSSEYVSDTIPATIIGGRTVSVSVTFRNKGVVWQEARGFRLGAAGDSDPFAAGRHTIAGTIGPNNTYTFTFNMTAPRASGDYTSDWQMVRDGFAWFGDIATKTVHVDPPTDNDAPSIPQNLAAAANGTTFIDLSWDASTDNEIVTGYNVYRNGTKIKFLNATAYRDTGLTPGVEYTYQVSAMDASSNESGLSNSAAATTIVDVTPPAAPTNVSAVGITDSRIDLSWTAAWDNLTIVNYKVFRDGALVGSPTGTSFSDTGLVAGASHTYQISAVDQSANESNRSAAVMSRTAELGNTVLWSDDFENYTSQASFEAAWIDATAPGLNWSSARSVSPTHAAEETNVAMNSVCDLPADVAQISAGTFFEFKYYDPAGASNVRHFGQIRSYSGGGHSGTLQELLSIGSYNAGGVNTGKYSGRSAFGVGGTNQGWMTLNQSRTAGWHTMRIDIVADNTNPISPGKALGKWSVDGTSGAENIAVAWKPLTSIYLGSGLSSTIAGSYFYDDVRFGIQGAVQRTGGPNVAQDTCATVTVTWKTDVDSTSRVDYGLTGAYGQSASDGTATKNHSITLTGLNPAAVYHLKVTSTAAGKTDSVSDDVTFSTAAESLVQLRGLPSGTTSGACGLIVSAVLPNGIYVQDANRICGMKVLGTGPVALGSIVTVKGDLATVGGERVLQNAIVTVTGTGAAPAAFGVVAKAMGGAGMGANVPGITDGIGANNIGLLVKVWGKVTAVGTGVFWIDDGTGRDAGDGKVGLKVAADNFLLPDVGDFVVATGISGAEITGGSVYPVLRPRVDTDLVVTPAL